MYGDSQLTEPTATVIQIVHVTTFTVQHEIRRITQFSSELTRVCYVSNAKRYNYSIAGLAETSIRLHYTRIEVSNYTSKLTIIIHHCASPGKMAPKQRLGAKA